ncbi:glucose-6-phosphate dehydrogenase assembly protein OpcA [Nakamurella leprariae]|uniref:Glucose-6-phosphate dehydrogenase assembly protein OpcA n=1 Tax=Nakamurella leprariae TaxID=2803911 RepID=A0A938YAS9_9ACTN|nr:glucose-6-phosphate dehydrogenase assembly protein OpcA [Nakamurella leprariae]MBM9466213.1 glucose-6-phosphate dehydrogenase assembly protein OpcA [Nakamurella leprariae]
MIIDLPSTTSSKINKAMVDLREKGGTVTLGRVLTLVIVTEEGSAEDPIEAANGASFEHPCRVIVVARGSKRGAPRMDAQIRVGGDAGASEVVVLRLYGALVDHGASIVVPLLLADAPVVAWWSGAAPAVPADDPIGALATRRITDSAGTRRTAGALADRLSGYRPGDTDLTWTRLTTWRGLLAAALDQPPHGKVTSVEVAGASDSVSTDLLAAWLALQLRCPVRRIKAGRTGSGVHTVTLSRREGSIRLHRPDARTATLSVTEQPDREVALPRRSLRDCIAEELRRLEPDDVYAEVLCRGVALVAKYADAPESTGRAHSAASDATPAPSGGRTKAPRRSRTAVPTVRDAPAAPVADATVPARRARSPRTRP